MTGFATRHLEEVGETYFEHGRHALSFSFFMLLGSVACFVHALFPFLFEKTGSGLIERLYDKMVINRKNLSKSASKNHAN
jgi:hypothetical protein